MSEMFKTYMLYFSGCIGYEEFSAFFRRKGCLVVQYLFIMLFFVAYSVLMKVPVIIVIGGAIIMLYGVVLISFAKTAKQQLLLSAIWGVTTFIIMSGILIAAVEFFGFEGF